MIEENGPCVYSLSWSEYEISPVGSAHWHLNHWSQRELLGRESQCRPLFSELHPPELRILQRPASEKGISGEEDMPSSCCSSPRCKDKPSPCWELYWVDLEQVEQLPLLPHQ